MLVLDVLLLLGTAFTHAAGAPEPDPQDDQRPVRAVDQSRYRAACPDYGQYSKYTLQ